MGFGVLYPSYDFQMPGLAPGIFVFITGAR
jgi:hypothetical protein